MQVASVNAVNNQLVKRNCGAPHQLVAVNLVNGSLDLFGKEAYAQHNQLHIDFFVGCVKQTVFFVLVDKAVFTVLPAQQVVGRYAEKVGTANNKIKSALTHAFFVVRKQGL